MQHASFHCVRLSCIFYELKVGGSPVTSESVGAIFPTVFFLTCLSVSHLPDSLNISNFVLILCVVVIGHPWMQLASTSGDG